MSLDVSLGATIDDDFATVFNANITHNCNKMADAAGIYGYVWRPEENGITHARQLVDPLEKGIALLRATPEHYRELEPANGWGSYSGLLAWLCEYLEACRQWPSAEVKTYR